ncbi:hypothetical protein ABZT17_35065 [Streptomyces sp. NPDC005648]|uniref:hypothetical protein n=1 Tax=Streptomyces sp. NPDC005648 TaxID=3157044 RepID=UPI0033B72FA8
MDGEPDETPDGVEGVPGQDVFPVPGFAAGGRVERTGIALVHEGEYIVPQAGSEAVISPPSGSAVVNYHFPVRIEIVGNLPDAEVRRVAGHVFDQLDRELSTRI